MQQDPDLYALIADPLTPIARQGKGDHSGQYLLSHGVAFRRSRKSKSFHGNLFDWNLQYVELGPMTYTMIDMGGRTGGGIMKTQRTEGTSNWLTYVQVDDASAATKKARSLGAEVMREKQEVPGHGWFTVIKYPTGAPLGL